MPLIPLLEDTASSQAGTLTPVPNPAAPARDATPAGQAAFGIYPSSGINRRARSPQPGGSVLDNPAPPDQQAAANPYSSAPLATSAGGPLRPEVRRQIENAWDAGTPEQRSLLEQATNFVGEVARERAQQAKARDAARAANPATSGVASLVDDADPRAEFRASRLVQKGEDPAFAETAGREGARLGVMPGKEVGAVGGTLQPSTYDFDTAALFNPNRDGNGLNNAPVRGLVKAGAGVGKFYSGLFEFQADVMGLDEAAKAARQMGAAARSTEEAIGERGDFLTRNFEGAVSSIAQQLPFLVGGVALGSKAVSLAGMAAQAFGQEYSDGKAQGQNATQAAYRASLMAALEVVGERFGLGQTMDALRAAARGAPTGEIGKLLLEALKREVPGELLTTTGQFAVDKFAGGGVGLRPNATFDDYLKQVADTIAQTLMQSGLMAGGTTGTSAAVRFMRDGGVSAGAAEAEAERAKQAALAKWAALSGGVQPRPSGARVDPELGVGAAPDAPGAGGRLEPWLGDDQLQSTGGFPAFGGGAAAFPPAGGLAGVVPGVPGQPAPAASAADPLMRLAELQVLAQQRALTPQEQAEFQRLVQQTDGEAAPAPAPAIPQATTATTSPWSGPPTGTLTATPATPANLAGRLGILPTAPAVTPPTAPAPDAAAGGVLPPADDEIQLQNRDRTRAASVEQMQKIARNPDYGRAGASRAPTNGAPMVFAVGDQTDATIPARNFGRQDIAVLADGTRVPFRYAVVDATLVQPSNFFDGSRNPAFTSTQPGTLKALNNARSAGLRGAYQLGTTDTYKAEMTADTAAHGVDPAAIALTPNPILVRVYSETSNVPNMGELSQDQGLGMSPVELAQQDAPLLDAGVIGLWQGGDVADAGNRDFVRAFVQKLYSSGQDIAKLMTDRGELSQDGERRINAAMMAAAYGDPNLVAELFDSTDTDIVAIGGALRQSAGRWVQMRDAARTGQVEAGFDFTPELLQAVRMVQTARRGRQSLAEMTQQVDLETGRAADPLLVAALRLLYGGANFTRARGREKVAALLRSYTDAAFAAGAGGGLFGDAPTALQTLQALTAEGDANAAAQAPDLLTPGAPPGVDGGKLPGQGAGTRPGAGDDGQAGQRPGTAAPGPGADRPGAGGAGPTVGAGAQGVTPPAAAPTTGAAPTAPAAPAVRVAGFEPQFEPLQVYNGLIDAMVGGLPAVADQELRARFADRQIAGPKELLPAGQQLLARLNKAGATETAQAVVDEVLGRRAFPQDAKPGSSRKPAAAQKPASSAPASAPATRQGATDDEEGKGQEAPEADVLSGQAGAPGQTPGTPADDLDAMFNDVLDEELGNTEPAGAAPTPPASPPPRTAGQAAASAAQNVGSGLTNAIDGLGALFGGNSPGRLGSGIGFDEETYEKAKPLFQAALANFKDAANDIKEAMRAVVRMVLDKFGENAARNMQPYVVRFIRDVRDGAVKLAAQQPGQPRLDMGDDPVAVVMGRVRRYASGMSAAGDLGRAGRGAGGSQQRGVGVDAGELSANGIEILANAVVNQRAALFVDSGAFGAFRRGLKSGTSKPLDFDALLDTYNRILEAIGDTNESEFQPGSEYPAPLMVMPDIVGDQAGSIELVRKYKRWIAIEAQGNLMRPIVPIQVGDKTMAEAYAEIVDILGTDNFIVGVPSNERAVSPEQFTQFLRDAKPKAVHILGAASDRTLAPRVRSIIESGMADTLEVTADASPIRSAILRAVQQGAKRGDAIEAFLLEPDDAKPSPDAELDAGLRRNADDPEVASGLLADALVGTSHLMDEMRGIARVYLREGRAAGLKALTAAAKNPDSGFGLMDLDAKEMDAYVKETDEFLAAKVEVFRSAAPGQSDPQLARLEAEYDRLLDRWNDLSRRRAAATGQEQERLTRLMDQLKPELDLAKAQALSYQRRIAEGRIKLQRRKEAAAKYGAMPIGTRIGMIPFPNDDSLFWEKTGADEWTRRGMGSDSPTKFNEEMEGDRVIGAPQADPDDTAAQAAGFALKKGMTNEWGAKVEHGSERDRVALLYTLRRVGGTEALGPRRYVLSVSATFPGSGVTGAPVAALGTFDTIDVALAKFTEDSDIRQGKKVDPELVSVLSLMGLSDQEIAAMPNAQRIAMVREVEEKARAVQFVNAAPPQGATALYIGTGEDGAMYTLRSTRRQATGEGAKVIDTYIRNLARDKDAAVFKARIYAAAGGVDRVFWGAPETLNAPQPGDRGGAGQGPIIDTSVPDTPEGVLAGAGLEVRALTSARGKPYWAVTGDTRTHEALLDALGFGKPFKMGGKWHRSVFDADPTERLVEALRNGLPKPDQNAGAAQGGSTGAAPDAAPAPSDADRAAVKAARLEVAQDGATWTVTGKGTFDLKDTLKELGGRWDGYRKAWTFGSDPTAGLAAALAKRAGGGDSADNAGSGASDSEDARRVAQRQREDSRADERADAGDVAQLVREDTKDLIRRGEQFGIPRQIVDEQIEDVGLILNAHAKGKPLFILANEAGTGKTYVLGGAIKELRQRGETRFIYVTMNTDLIAQIQRDLADFGVKDVEFHTYSEMSTKDFDTDGAILIFDEAHNVKNVGAETARANKGQELIGRAKMTLFASATPFENPVEARYLQATGVFDTVGGFNEWAQMYGAAVKRRKFYNPRTGQEQVEEIIYWPGKGKKEDGAAARQWLFKQAVMTQRAMRIDPGMTDTTFRRAAVEPKWVALYDRVVAAYEAALAAWTTEDGMPRDAKIVAEISRHRENTVKRILEASKIPFAIDEAQKLLAAGRNVVIFVETKAERQLGKWKRSEHFKDDTLYTYPQMVEMMAEWQMAANMARQMQEKAPPRPFAEFIYELARYFHNAGIDTGLPSTSDDITAALGADNVAIYTGAVSNTAAAKNKADFMAGRKRVLVATMAKGGTGLSLHDTVGNRPTSQLNINLPWKATGVDQVAARVARYGLRSRAEVTWLFASNIPWERNKLAPRVGARMREMGAIVKGLELKSAEMLDGGFDFEGDVNVKGFSTIETRPEGEDAKGDVYERAQRLERTRRPADDTSGGFFETPFPLAALMANVAGVAPGQRLLEPSAGRGNLLRLLPEGVDVVAVERRHDNARILQSNAPAAEVIEADFLAVAGPGGKLEADLIGATRGYTFGDLFRHPDGRLGIMRGGNGERVRFIPEGKTEREFEYVNRSDLEGVEFRGTGGGFNTVLMNPPFEREAGIGAQDIEHVQRAYTLLAPGGRLVAVMGEGPFFRQSRQDTLFREWLDEHGAVVVELPEGTFKQSGTMVRTRLVVIDRDARPGRTDLKLADLETESLRDLEALIPARAAGSREPPGAQVLLGEEQTVYGVNNPGANYDLFPDELTLQPAPAPRVAPRPTQRAGAKPAPAPAENAAPAVPVVAVRASPTLPGVYRVTDQLVSVNVRDLPVASVKTWQDAVDALQAIGEYAVEHFDALITDKSGKPLAVVGAFKGATAQTSVYPTTVLAEALRIKGAATAWGVHNHPSGNAELSRADEYLNQSLAGFFRDTSVRWAGLAAVGNGGDWRVVEGNGSQFYGGKVRAGGAVAARVPVVERLIRRVDQSNVMIGSPAEAKDVVQSLSGGQPGIVFLAHSHRVTAWVPMTRDEMSALKKDDRLGRLLNSGASSGAAAYIISMPSQGRGQSEMAAAQNLANALTKLDLRLLDVIDPVTRASMAERGTQPTGSLSGTLYDISTKPTPAAEQGPAKTAATFTGQIAYTGYPTLPVPRVQGARNLRKLVNRLAEGEITETAFVDAVRVLSNEMAVAAGLRMWNRLGTQRQRGPDLVREKLLAARRREEIDPDGVEFALWALGKNPALAAGLGIGVRTPGEANQGVAGDYNPATEVMRLFKGQDNEQTAVHEILHHAERMMPAPMQARIRRDWARALARAVKTATPEQREALALIGPAMAGDSAAQRDLKRAFSDGVLYRHAHYHLVNPSEFWAVNAAGLLWQRFDARDSGYRRVLTWMREMLERVKSLLGLRANGNVLRALDGLLNPARNDGEFQSRRMLGEMALGDTLLDRRTVRQGRIRRSIDSLVVMAQEQESWKDWYSAHQDVIRDLFGQDADLFQQILSATSQMQTVKGNVTVALRAYEQMVTGQPFRGYLEGVVRNLDRIRAGQGLQGPKIGDFQQANVGDDAAMAIDRHIAQLLFNTSTPSARQIESAKKRIRAVAARLGWTPRQAQAALWAANQVRLGRQPQEVASYAGVLETRRDAVAALRARLGRGGDAGVQPGLATAAGPAGSGGPDGRGGRPDAGGDGAGQDDRVAFSRAQPASGAMRAEDVQAVADRIASRWAQSPEIVVVQSVDDPRVPQAIRAENERQMQGGGFLVPQGVFYKGKVYLFADGQKSITQVAETLFHEVEGHYGLQAVFGSSLDRVLDMVAMARPELIRAKAGQYGKVATLEEARAAVTRMRRKSGAEPLAGAALDASAMRLLRKERREVAEEVLAHMAQTQPELGFVRRAVAAIRTWLRENMAGFGDLRLTDDEIIRSYILPARNWVERGEAAGAPDGRLAFQRKASDITTMARLQRVLREGVGGRPVYLRFARDIEGDVRGRRSKNWVDGQREMGLSVVQLVESPDALGYFQPFEDLPQDHPANLGGGINNYIDYLGFRHAKGAYLVTGDVVGIGSDGEPLVANASVIGEVSKTVLVEGLMAWSQEYERREVQRGRAPGLVARNEKLLTNELRLGAELEEVKRAASAPDGRLAFARAEPTPVKQMSQTDMMLEITRLIPQVEKAYEAGPRSARMAERLDMRLEELMEALESGLVEQEEDQLTAADLLNPLLASKRGDGEQGDTEADLVRDLANLWRDMTGEGFGRKGTVAEQAEMVRGLLGDYADRHGGLAPGVTDQQMLDAARDAYEAVYGVRARQIERARAKAAAGVDTAQPRPATEAVPMFSRSSIGPTPPPQPGPAQRNRWHAIKQRVMNLTSMEAWDTLRYKVQDRFIDLLRVQERIKALGGTITDLNDMRLGEELFHKRLAVRTERFLADELRPLLQALKDKQVPLEAFEEFLHARHAPEANAAMAKRNPSQAEIDALELQAEADLKALRLQLQRAQAQGTATAALEASVDQARERLAEVKRMQAFPGTEDERLSLSGMSDAQAAAVMAGLSPQQRTDLDALAAQVDAINTKTVDSLVSYGLIDRQTAAAWRQAYQHYIPLHRDEAHPESKSHPIGQGYNVRGAGVRERVGSNQKVTNILTHIAMQREAALTRGEKNLVLQRLYLLVGQNPMQGFWRIGNPPMHKTIDPVTGTVRRVIDGTYRNEPNVVTLRIAGKDTSIIFERRDPRAERLATAIKSADIGDLGWVSSRVGVGTRWFASINTQYNPIFGVINMVRDVQAAALNLSTTPLAGKELQVLRGVHHAMRAVYRQERGKGAANATNAQWVALWKDLQEVGGTTGYRDLFADIEDRAKGLQKEIEALDRGQVSRAAHAVVDWLSDYNEAMENAVRVSAYKAALEQGMSKERAASLAKNLTVNFNRKGQKTRDIGAWYAFFNAAVQGTTRMVETLTGPAGRKIMAGGVALGAVNALVGMAFMGGFGDDDEEDNWSKIPDFVKERSLVIPVSSKDYLAIPLPLGFNFLPNIGRLAVEFALGGPEKTAGKQLGSLMGVMLDAFNPLGGAQPAAQMVAPTVIDPVVALLENKDWTGRPIYREDRSPLDPQPGTALVKDTASPAGKGIAAAINAVTGGTKYTPGAWSPTPDQIDYVFGQLTGGLGREINKAVTTAASPVTGDEVPLYKLPLIGRVVGTTRGASGQSEKFYENVKEINKVENELRGRARNQEDVAGYQAEEPLAQLAGAADRYSRRVSELRQLRRDLNAKEPPGYREDMKRVDADIEATMRDLNARVRAVQRGVVAAAN